MVEGLKKVVRYYPYYARGFNLTKKLLLKDGYFDEQESLNPLTSSTIRTRVLACQNIQQVIEVIKPSQNAFFVNVPIESRVHPNQTLNGTRINCVANNRFHTAFKKTSCHLYLSLGFDSSSYTHTYL